MKKTVIYSYLSKFIGIIIGLVYTPIILRMMNQNEYGIYSISLSLISYFSLFDFGISSSYIKFYSLGRKQGNLKEINGTYFIVFLIIALISGIIGLFTSNNIDVFFDDTLSLLDIDEIKSLFNLLLLNNVISFIFLVFSNFIIANEKFIILNIFQIIRQLSNPLIGIPLLFLGYGSKGLIYSMVSTNLFIIFLSVYYAVQKLKIKFSFRNFKFNMLRDVGKYSFYIFVNIIVDQINNNLDTLIIGKYTGTIEVAIFGIAQKFSIYYSEISTALSYVFTPRIHQMEIENATDDKFTFLFIKVGRIQYLVLSQILINFILFGKFFVLVWAGKEYINAYYVAIMLLIPITIPLIQNIGIEIQRAKNLHSFRSKTYLFMGLINIIVSIPLTKMYGAIGASIGTGLSYLLGNGLIMNLHYHNKVGINIRDFWKEIIKILKFQLIIVFFFLIANFVSANFITFNYYAFILKALILNLLVLIINYKKSLNDFEKKLLISFFRREE